MPPRFLEQLLLITRSLIFANLALACSDTHVEIGGANSQTHWLKRCSANGECGTLSCICGLCSAACESGSLCETKLGEHAVCRAATTVADSDACAPPQVEAQICVAECQSDAQCSLLGAGLGCSEGFCRAAVARSAGMGGASAAKGGAGAGGQVLEIGGAGAADAAVDSAVGTSHELSCQDGAPVHLPANIELVASDTLENFWTISADVLTWFESDPLEMSGGSGSKTIWHQPLKGGNPSSVVADVVGISLQGFTANGADTVLFEFDRVSVSSVTAKLLPSSGAALNLATEPGSAGVVNSVLDTNDLYWIGSNQNKLTLWRSSRTPGESASLGELMPLNGVSLQGLIAIGDQLYVATDQGQVFRASKDGSQQLAAFGPTLPPVRSLGSDDSDLLVMLDAQLDTLKNVVVPPRIARMNENGTLKDVAKLDMVGSDLAVHAGRIYWRVNDNTKAVWTAALWSVAADGSDTPTQVLTTPGNLLSYGVSSYQDSVYFAIYCRVDFGMNMVGGRTHILRLRP